MHILMVSSEATPFAKTGGLGDAVWALARSLASRGHKVDCILPRYSWIDVSDAEETAAGCLESLEPEAYRIVRLVHEGLDVYFVDTPRFATREGIYGDADGGYADNPLRFSILGHAACTLIGTQRSSGSMVMHGHDWHAGVAIGLASECGVHTTCETGSSAPGKQASKLEGIGQQRIGTVLTVHNGAYIGSFPKHDVHYTGLPARAFKPRLAAIRPDISFLYAGVKLADRITTVSPGYADELTRISPDDKANPVATTDDGDTEADLRLLMRERTVTGILNGVDYSQWNPETDRLIPRRYSANALEGKAACKQALLDAFGLSAEQGSETRPVIGMVARLTDQKGLEELCFPTGGALAKICSLEAVVVILGTGEKRYEAELVAIAARYDNLSVRIDFDESVAHLIEAGSDLYLMPSRFEPCGLNQLYSLRYGTPPVVHATGGLADTIHESTQTANDGNGYRYVDQTPDSIVAAVSRAVDVFRLQPAVHRSMMLRGMAEDHSWAQTAGEYESIYKSVLQ